MSSFSDLTILDSDWTDLYTVLGTATTSTLQFSNKGSVALLYQEAVSKPLTASTSGIVILPDQQRHSVLPKVGEKIWLKCISNNDNTVESTIVATLLG